MPGGWQVKGSGVCRSAGVTRVQNKTSEADRGGRNVSVHFLLGVAAAIVLTAGPASATPPEPRLTYAGLREMIRSRRIQTVEDLLAALPASFRNGHFALIPRSGSAQASSPTEPRVLLFGEDARLIIGYRSARTGTGAETLEIMEWDPAQAQYRPREIVLGRPPRFHENPENCARCHGTDTHLIWGGGPAMGRSVGKYPRRSFTARRTRTCRVPGWSPGEPTRSFPQSGSVR